MSSKQVKLWVGGLNTEQIDRIIRLYETTGYAFMGYEEEELYHTHVIVFERLEDNVT